MILCLGYASILKAQEKIEWFSDGILFKQNAAKNNSVSHPHISSSVLSESQLSTTPPHASSIPKVLTSYDQFHP